MHDIGAEAPNRLPQFEVRSEVRPWPDLAPQVAKLEELDIGETARLGEQLARIGTCERHGELVAVEPCDGIQRVALRTPEFEHCDRVQDLQAAHPASRRATVAPSHSASSIVEYFHSAHRPASATPAARYASRSVDTASGRAASKIT